MHLVWALLNGYKRFEQPAKVDLEAKLVALIGPNEVGKTSILNALQHVNNEMPFARAGSMQELTRGATIEPDQIVVEASFLLEPTERRALARIHEGDQIRFLDVVKYADGSIEKRVRPAPSRDLSALRQLAEAIRQHRGVPAQKDLESHPTLQDPFLTLGAALDSLQENEVNADALAPLTALAESIEGYDLTTFSPEMNALLTAIQAAERAFAADHPADLAAAALDACIPKFLLFSDADRTLQPSYDVTSADAFPPALSNICRLAALDLPALREAILSDNHAAAETLIHAANVHLKEIFQVSWSQSGVSVHFRVDSTTLHVLVEGGDRAFTSIAERSDGLRHFVALLAFVTLRDPSAVKPILLIDELEAHLHYDAQADLAQMMVKQQVAAKVIYTTHSFGCLPEDLGTGVRTIEPVKTKPDRSRVNNWFWESDGLGFDAVLFGMGASATAFIPIRKALFAEGPADFVLLPSMLKEASAKPHLGFQVVPGLSTISREQAPLIEGRAAKVAFLVDADSGGQDIEAKLKRAGFSPRQIHRLPDPSGEGLVLEDFVDQQMYAAAVSECLRRRYGQKKLPTVPDLQPPNRPARLAEWCSSNNLEPPGRRAVAYQVLQARVSKTIVDPSKRTSLSKLYRDVASSLGLATR